MSVDTKNSSVDAKNPSGVESTNSDRSLKNSFETTTTGKWILAGEHTVLRGGRALVFPLPSATLKFSFLPKPAMPNADQTLILKLSGSTGSDFELLFWSVLERACALTHTRRDSLQGEVCINSEIPVGAGLGASAAFCVAIARWFSQMGKVPAAEIADFARELENLFHGESSGVDIAVAHSGKPLRFERGGICEVFEPAWHPQMFLSYTGQRGVTKECVTKVKQLIQESPATGADIDSMMKQAVEMAEKALQMNEKEGLPQLVKALKLSAECFSAWGLFEGAPEKQASDLSKKGALAVKPTGSGGGGYNLSLWNKKPDSSLNLLSGF